MNDVDITKYLCDMVFASMDELVTRLTRLGVEVVSRDQKEGEDVVTFLNPNFNIVVAIDSKSPPPIRAVCLAYTLFGKFGVAVYPGLIPAVEEEWRCRRKSAAMTTCVNPASAPEEAMRKRSSKTRQRIFKA